MNDHTPEEQEDGRRIAELDQANADLRAELQSVQKGSAKVCAELRAECERLKKDLKARDEILSEQLGVRDEINQTLRDCLTAAEQERDAAKEERDILFEQKVIVVQQLAARTHGEAEANKAERLTRMQLVAVREEIGQPPEGFHPDEAKPRAATWHQERANWRQEVGQLRFELFNREMLFKTTLEHLQWINDNCDRPSAIYERSLAAIDSARLADSPHDVVYHDPLLSNPAADSAARAQEGKT